MSILKLELTEKHVKLLKHLKVKSLDNYIILSVEDGEDIPITDNDKYSYIDLILNGKPSNFDPLHTEEIIEYSEEQKTTWDALYAELPLALEIILYNGHFELGIYRAKFHDRQWKKKNL